MKKNRRFIVKILLVCCLALFAVAGYSQSALSITSDKGALPLFTPDDQAYILSDADDAPVVGTAARLLRGDIAAVTGSSDSIAIAGNVLTDKRYAIIIGTVGQSAYIDQLVSVGKLDVSDIKDKWETYKMQTVSSPLQGIDKALVIAGSTPRGTAYGTLELSRLMGVHPWCWWADVKPEQKPSLYITEGSLTSKEPSVKYRGLFINDEDWGMYVWAKATIDKEAGSIGPRTYERVMELLLRMKANLLWPAMHECLGAKTFWYYDECHELARRYGIVLGSSHCDVMLRCNNSDWLCWKGYSKTDFNYATNRATVQNYWAERAGESKDIEAIYTIGMRGVHDSGIAGYSTTADKVAGLTDIFAYQRQLIQDSIAAYKGTTVDKIPQTFIPYKEVLDAYNAGLKVPDDVTLCWVDDNHGYIRQLPNDTEQQRTGGGGIYYHLSYYGSPHDYLWLSSISPSLISYELCKAYDTNVRNMWIINVGDIKPAEEELQFCMDLAWDIDSWRPQSAYDYTEQWATDIFGTTLGEEIASIKNEYYRLAAGGKPEHIAYNSYSEAEQNQRIADYNALMNRVNALNSQIPERLKYAFYQLVRYPICGACYMNRKIFYAAQSLTHAAAGYSDAVSLANKATTAFTAIVNMTKWYNTGSQNNEDTSNPKWNGIMSYCPRVAGNSHFNMPTVATSADIAATVDSIREDSSYVIPASEYASASASLKVIRGLGTSANALGVLPVTAKSYTVSDAPRATYTLPVHKGKNVVEIRLLPTFPLNTNCDLRMAYSIAGSDYKTVSIKTTATSTQWGVNVLRGYASVTTTYNATADGEVSLSVAMLDPSVVLNDVKVTLAAEGETTDITGAEDKTGLLKNPDFSVDGNSKQSGKVPTYWTYTGTTSYSSISVTAKGTNSEIAGGQPHWQVWKGTGVMSQTVSNLPAGEYIIEANIVATGASASTLFANNSNRSLTATAGIYRVSTQVEEGGSLKLGINKKESDSDIEVDDFKLYYKPLSTGMLRVTPSASSGDGIVRYYTLDGRQLSCSASDSCHPQILLVRSADGKVSKIIQ